MKVIFIFDVSLECKMQKKMQIWTSPHPPKPMGSSLEIERPSLLRARHNNNNVKWFETLIPKIEIAI